jgi:integrase
MEYIAQISGNANYPFRKLTSSSARNYAYDLNVYFDFVERKIIQGEWKGDSLWSATDLTLESFCEHLETTPSRKGRPRSANAIRKIIRRTIDFYIESKKYGLAPDNMCGNEDDGRPYQINYSVKEISYARSDGRRVTTTSITHYTEPKQESVNGCEPISDEEILLWNEAIYKSSNNPFIQKRWEIIEILLEFTGGRPSEIESIKASQVIKSGDNDQREVVITTTKGKNKRQKRTLNLPKREFEMIYLWAKHNRPPLINKAMMNGNIRQDHDHLLLLANGEHMTGRSITNHIGDILRKAGIKRVSAKKFRHRFITLNLAHKISEHMAEHGYNDNTYSLAVSEIRKMTLHASKSSVEQYISLAYLYINKKSVKTTHKERELDEFGRACIAIMQSQIRQPSTIDELETVDQIKAKLVNLFSEIGIDYSRYL